MLENRRHLRFREVFDIRWTVLGTNLTGEGQVLNMSSSGFLLRTDGNFDPKRSGVLYIDSQDDKPLVFGSKKGKIVWLRRISENRPGYLCGVEFLKDSPQDKKLEGWLETKTDELSRISDANILINFLA